VVTGVRINVSDSHRFHQCRFQSVTHGGTFRGNRVKRTLLAAFFLIGNFLKIENEVIFRAFQSQDVSEGENKQK
jgi:hypothetical protein